MKSLTTFFASLIIVGSLISCASQVESILYAPKATWPNKAEAGTLYTLNNADQVVVTEQGKANRPLSDEERTSFSDWLKRTFTLFKKLDVIEQNNKDN